MDLIISRYKEDISWITKLPNFINPIVYNKFDTNNDGFSLPNVGREGHTYLHHIIKNYENLSEINIFCQGNPLDHNPNIIENLSNHNKIKEIIQGTGFYPLGQIITEGPYANIDVRHKCGLPMFYVFHMLFDFDMSLNDVYNTVYGAQFIVHKNNIVSRPKSFYTFIYNILSYDKDPIEGYILERLWPYIFNFNIPLSSKILYFISKA